MKFNGAFGEDMGVIKSFMKNRGEYEPQSPQRNTLWTQKFSIKGFTGYMLYMLFRIH